MKILGIESSCDETAVAVVESGTKVLASQVLSQIERHKVFGGVVPEIAAREHMKAIDPLVKSTLQEAGLEMTDIDAIAVTQGPGLIGALLVGVSYAKGLSLSTGLPLIPVNHVHAHVQGALLGVEKAVFPALALVVSGGHTNVYHMPSHTEFRLMAHTIDDACGECFDKVAKLFGLGYPGGPIVEKTARKGDPTSVAMPTMLEDRGKLAFSYSGLKTYMVNLYQREKNSLDENRVADIMASFQEEALGHLVRKTRLILEKSPSDMVLVAGGVAANKRFRELLTSAVDAEVVFPNLAFCSDNAAMIAALGYREFEKSGFKKEPYLSLDWDCYSRYPYAP